MKYRMKININEIIISNESNNNEIKYQWNKNENNTSNNEIKMENNKNKNKIK